LKSLVSGYQGWNGPWDLVCVTGAFTQNALSRLLGTYIMVMAETQIFQSSVCLYPLPATGCLDSAACVSLPSIQLSKSNRYGFGLSLTIAVNKRRTRSPSGSPQNVETRCFCESRARIGRRSTACPEQDPNKYYRPGGVNNRFCFFHSFDQAVDIRLK